MKAYLNINALQTINRYLGKAVACIDEIEMDTSDQYSQEDINILKKNLSDFISGLKSKRVPLDNLEAVSFVDNDILVNIMNQMVEYAELNFSRQLKMDSEDDVLNTMATTVNLLGEELEDKIKKLQELNITLEVSAEKSTARNQELSGIMKALDNSALIFITDTKGVFVKANKGFCEASKYREDELLGMSHEIFDSSFHSKEFWNGMLNTIEKGRAWRNEVKGKAKDNSYFWIDIVINPITNVAGNITHYLGISNLITDKKLQEAQLIESEKAIRQSLQEKDILLQEVHHRVKNNLQMISSLMELQIRRTRNPEVAEQLSDSQKRVRAMAVLHEKLYKSDNISIIDISDYTKNLVYSYTTMYGSEKGERIKVSTNIEAEIFLNIEKAIPYGLIFNELISNCYKHAFGKNEKGTITVALFKKGKKIHLVVKDSGKGLDKELDIKKLKSLGIKLITSLANQLKAELKFKNDNGLEVSIILN